MMQNSDIHGNGTTGMFTANTLYAFLERSKWPSLQNGDSLITEPDSDDMLGDGTPFDQIVFANPLSLASVASPYVVQEQLFHLMHRSMFPSTETVQIPEQLRMHGNWFNRLPPLTGRNSLLDTAVRAVTLAHLGRLHGSDEFLRESRPYYGKTLRLLNSALCESDQGMAGETLAATMLLSFYEMFASSSNTAWVQHAGGAGALMKARGPDHHRFGFDREMFIAYRHTIIIEACQRDEPCFLAEPAWRELSKSIFYDLRSSGQDEEFLQLFDLAEQLFENMLELPELLHRAKHSRLLWKREKDQFPTWRDFIADLAKRCNLLRTEFRLYSIRFKSACSRIGMAWTTYLSHDPVIPLYYHFPNIFIGSSITGYWTINILLNLVLMELVKESEPERIGLFRAENRDSALELCRSVNYMLRSSFLGPFFIIFGLRISLAALQDNEERNWVISRLFEIGNTHMAMAAHIPGFEPGAGLPRVRAAISSGMSFEEIV
jgi:hypothetical protein